MGAVRTTQRLLIDRGLGDLSLQQREILRLQEQLSTGQKVNRPSDDSLATRRAVSARSEIARNEQYITNISSAGPLSLETESALRTTIDVIQRVRELTLQGASGTNAQLQRDEIAIEIDQLLEGLLVEGNKVSNGRFVFGGTVTLSEPFEATRGGDGRISSVDYVGNDEIFSIEIQDGVRVAANEPGSSVFIDAGAGGSDIFQVFIDIRDNLEAGNVGALETRLDELSDAQDQILVATARIGATQNRLERVQSNLEDINQQLLEVIADNIDADFGETIVELNAQNNSLQASLNASARVIQPSLLAFLQ
ncbi:MAG: flagellar hook-associated protein FlgL, partial [Candidatus Hydrogenedentes bacterium]|nr:flagellar hook-associated protein FlgL [Candidatus Hydrogenedentota bacterium]